MTIKECIDGVDNIKPNQYSIRDKVLWLSFIDEIIINDMLKAHEGYDGRYDDFVGYSEDKLSMPLIVPSPYDRLYTAYLKMKIDGENGETARYNNSAAMFNTYMMEYRKYYNKTHMPLNKGHKNKTIPPKPFKDGLTEAEFENLKKELYYLLSDDFAEMTSNDKLYAIVTNYMNTNAAMLKGKDGLNGVDGKNGYTPRKGIDYFDGEKGDKGDPGYTPQKGIDYFTDEDIVGLNIPAVNISFDNSNSGLASENVQDAIDEIAIKIDDMFKIESWADVQNIVNLGMAHNVFKVGEQFECSHTKYGTLIWDIVDVAPEKISLCTHKCITNLKFDIEEALYYAETELAPGTYNFTVVNQIWYPSDNGKTFQFTLTKPVPQGGQIVLDMTYNNTLAGKGVYTYPSGGSTALIEAAPITQGSGGTALGKTDGSVANVNHIQRAIMGSNNYKESFLRQWLNSDGAAGTFWTSQTVFDRLSSWPYEKPSIDGFMNGLDADFLAVVSDTTYDVGLNNVTDGGGKETLTDKFVLLSRDEIYAGSEGGVTQGKPLPYFSEFSYNGNPSTETDNNRIKTDARGVATDWWLRSPNTIYAGSVRYVSPSGVLNSNVADRTFGVAPACNIIKKQ